MLRVCFLSAFRPLVFVRTIQVVFSIVPSGRTIAVGECLNTMAMYFALLYVKQMETKSLSFKEPSSVRIFLEIIPLSGYLVSLAVSVLEI